jgi:hypothetical protein
MRIVHEHFFIVDWGSGFLRFQANCFKSKRSFFWRQWGQATAFFEVVSWYLFNLSLIFWCTFKLVRKIEDLLAPSQKSFWRIAAIKDVERQPACISSDFERRLEVAPMSSLKHLCPYHIFYTSYRLDRYPTHASVAIAGSGATHPQVSMRCGRWKDVEKW